MATVWIPSEQRHLNETSDITEYLASAGIGYEQWTASKPLADNATATEVLSAYEPEIERLKNEGGYVTADVIDVSPDTPNLDVMLAKFNREHWHDEDEVRFVVEGRGLFHLHPPGFPVMAVTVEAGDLLRVPRGMWHWFDLCGDRRIRAIRLFQDPGGWSPHYTNSGVDAGHQPICFGPRGPISISLVPPVEIPRA